MPSNYDTIPKQTLFIIVAGVGLLYLYTNLMPSGLPKWMSAGTPPPRKDGKTGFPETDNLPEYQPSVESNEGETPVSSQQSNFGK
jgi:hypothetical protein